MKLETIAILSPGDMGHAVGRVLKQRDFRVVTCLNGRSARTRSLAKTAGLEELPTIAELVATSDLILSIVAPVGAMPLARVLAAAITKTGVRPYFAECNAVSPRTAAQINSLITVAGGRFIDASIIGPPPGKGEAPRFYTSGIHAPVMSRLQSPDMQVRTIGDKVGAASGIKMCYAALTKGSQALWVALLMAARRMDLSDELRAEFEHSQTATLAQMEKQLPGMVAKAPRWVAEMEEIAATFENVGVVSGFHQGAAEVYRMIAATPFATETPETLDTGRTLEQTLATIAGSWIANQHSGTDS